MGVAIYMREKRAKCLLSRQILTAMWVRAKAMSGEGELGGFKFVFVVCVCVWGGVSTVYGNQGTAKRLCYYVEGTKLCD